MPRPHPVPQDRDKARLEGQVLNSARGTAAQGSEREGQLPVRTYTVTSDADLRFGNTANGKRADPILLHRADRKTGYIAKMTPYGAIAGVTLDEDGDPIRNLHVSAMSWRYTTNGRELREEKSADSNDLGEYRIFDLPTGRYLLKINPRPLRFDGVRDKAGYGSLYYPGTATDAIPQDLKPRQEIRPLSFNLRKVHVPTIRGKVIAPADASNVSAGSLIATDGGSSSTSSGVDSETGKFELARVAQGSIFLTGSYAQGGLRYDILVPLDAGATDIDGVELRPLPPADIPAQIAVEGDPTYDVSRISISLNGPSPGHLDRSNSVIGQDGRL